MLECESKVNIDERAFFRQKTQFANEDFTQKDRRKLEAKDFDLNYFIFIVFIISANGPQIFLKNNIKLFWNFCFAKSFLKLIFYIPKNKKPLSCFILNEMIIFEYFKCTLIFFSILKSNLPIFKFFNINCIKDPPGLPGGYGFARFSGGALVCPTDPPYLPDFFFYIKKLLMKKIKNY